MSDSTIEPRYTIGVASRILNTTPQSLRLYESEGLILPYRTSTNRRIYSDIELDRVRCIQRMIREEGMNFSGLRHLYALIPCWKLRDHPYGDHENCPAFLNRSQPCWTMTEKCLHPEESCRECPVYLESADCSKFKDMIFQSQWPI